MSKYDNKFKKLAENQGKKEDKKDFRAQLKVVKKENVIDELVNKVKYFKKLIYFRPKNRINLNGRRKAKVGKKGPKNRQCHQNPLANRKQQLKRKVMRLTKKVNFLVIDPLI